MSKLLRIPSLPALLALGATALLLVSLKFPLWHLRMEAPQYREEEALKVAVYPGALRGDLNEITVLNQYIGVHIPKALPQLKWLPIALVAGGLLGFAAALLPRQRRRAAGLVVPALVGMALLVAAVQAQFQMYDIGHKRDAKTKLVGVKNFTTPLLGHTKIAQFEVTSGFGLGAYLIAAAIALQLAAVMANGKRKAQGRNQNVSNPSATDWQAGLRNSLPCPNPEQSR